MLRRSKTFRHRLSPSPKMLRTIVLLTILAAVVHGSGWTVPKLLIRFGLNFLKIGSEYYISVPLNKIEALSEGWVSYPAPPASSEWLDVLELLCPSNEDLTVCAYYDDTGYIAGLLYSFNKACVYDPAFDMTKQGYSDWSVTWSNGTTNEYWSTRQLYVNADYLATDSATRISNRSTTSILNCDNVWFTGFDGELYSVSTSVTELTASDSDFTEQACIPFMGHHHYYKMYNTTECKEDTLFPYFMLEYSKQYVGYGLMLFAKTQCDRNWYESPAKSDVEMIVPTGPTCLYDMVDTWGLITIHAYVVDTPYYISCLFE